MSREIWEKDRPRKGRSGVRYFADKTSFWNEWKGFKR
ncbi:hypothetical protein OVS_02270 [Mycoplasma ovis str. Michigan]|uniref:Uncharacterized protein n=1 Tax=Mycoplasma ovis str. Michigan TaxID=1415773 RepID=A0ABN4BN54_9MOLU|nr:hypothetical protein OVS_02270 [Mycoplasma ovis str. Michigan]